VCVRRVQDQRKRERDVKRAAASTRLFIMTFSTKNLKKNAITNKFLPHMLEAGKIREKRSGNHKKIALMEVKLGR
jgi:hypothetical protein